MRAFASGMCGYAEIGRARWPVKRPPLIAANGTRWRLAASNSTMRAEKPQHQPQYASITYTTHRAGRTAACVTPPLTICFSFFLAGSIVGVLLRKGGLMQKVNR